MRPLRLDLAGFTVFRDETTIDFTDADFFALVGPTGSGKSSVLDAICFALYGTVPRWGDRRAIANALAPSATEARVRLAFESAGSRYVATRVVRRDGKGRVATSHAGLQLMPAGFDVSTLDTGLSADDLGEVLAGTPAEMDAAVLETVGLPYEQFTACVVLPQGEFAEFLHAKPATRQQILVNLLGLHVYERVRERATAMAADAEAQRAAVDRLLADAVDVSDADLATAAARVDALRGLAAEVDTRLPALAAAARDAATARAALVALDAELAQLGTVRPPAGLDALTGAAAAARALAADALAAVSAAEEREEKVRDELATAGSAATLRQLVDACDERASLAAKEAALGAAVTSAEAEQRTAEAALAGARADATRAAEALDAARVEYQAAQAADRAAALRAHLALDEPCPVCTQPVRSLPSAPHESAIAEAEAAGKAARAVTEAATAIVAERDAVARDLDRALAGARAQRDQLIARIAELDARIAAWSQESGWAIASERSSETSDAAGFSASERSSAASDAVGFSVDLDAVRRELARIATLQSTLDDAAAAVRSAREAHRRAAAVEQRAGQQLRTAWRAFDAARDAVAALNPPPADRDDLAAAWVTLAGWASSEVDNRRADWDRQAAEVAAAEDATGRVAGEIDALFTAAGLPSPRGGTAQPGHGGAASRSGGASAPGGGADLTVAYPRVAAVAVERARAEGDRLAERREANDRLRAQRAEHERAAHVAKALAGHLRANNFERWLLAEALDLLVDGASRTLRELSGGQYDLVHDKGEFSVIDHHDAGLRRAVRTLSGGETFQASLALALALSEQLAGLSTSAASLESIVLDEGFGTLDASTLDTVAATLENLAARGDRMVGVVTHVGPLAERIPVRYEVTKDARTARVERVGL